MKKKLLCLMICLLCVTLTSCKSQDYENAQALLDAGEFDQAEQAFSDLGDYKDSAEKIKEAKYLKACSILDSGDIEQASSMFRDLIGWSSVKILDSKFEEFLSSLSYRFKFLT